MKLVKKIVLWIIVAFVAIIVIAALFGSDTTSDTDVADETTTSSLEETTTAALKETTTEFEIETTTELAIETTTQKITETTTKTATNTTQTSVTTTQASVTTTKVSTQNNPPSTTQPPHVHKFKAATCTTPKICSCGATEGVANGHSWTKATYSSPKTCTVCGVTEGKPLDVPNKENYHGHVYTGGSSSKKYHYETDCAGKNSHEITWDDVQQRNLGPCGTCVLK